MWPAVVLVLLIRAELGRVGQTKRNIGSITFMVYFSISFSKGKELGKNHRIEVLLLLGSGSPPWG